MPITFTDKQLIIIAEALDIAHEQLNEYVGEDHEELYGKRIKHYERMMEKIKRYERMMEKIERYKKRQADQDKKRIKKEFDEIFLGECLNLKEHKKK